MEPNGSDRCWDDRVREAVELGPEQLRNLLSTEPPGSKEKYILCLEFICQHHEQDLIANGYSWVLEEARCQVLFNTLRDRHLNPSFHSTKAERIGNELSARNLRQRRRDSQAKKPPSNLISFYDIFLASIVRWRDSAEHDPQNVDHPRLRPFEELNCSPVTKLIWEASKEELFEGGAIHACAQHGLDKFLQFLLGRKLRREPERDVKELVKVAFLAGPDTDLTPLGIAIREQQLECSKCSTLSLQHPSLVSLANYEHEHFVSLTFPSPTSSSDKRCGEFHSTGKKCSGRWSDRYGLASPGLRMDSI
jgi:hypothetical protein